MQPIIERAHDITLLAHSGQRNSPQATIRNQPCSSLHQGADNSLIKADIEFNHNVSKLKFHLRPASLPALVFGPVVLRALARLEATFFAVVIVILGCLNVKTTSAMPRGRRAELRRTTVSARMDV